MLVIHKVINKYFADITEDCHSQKNKKFKSFLEEIACRKRFLSTGMGQQADGRGLD